MEVTKKRPIKGHVCPFLVRAIAHQFHLSYYRKILPLPCFFLISMKIQAPPPKRIFLIPLHFPSCHRHSSKEVCEPLTPLFKTWKGSFMLFKMDFFVISRCYKQWGLQGSTRKKKGLVKNGIFFSREIGARISKSVLFFLKKNYYYYDFVWYRTIKGKNVFLMVRTPSH